MVTTLGNLLLLLTVGFGLSNFIDDSGSPNIIGTNFKREVEDITKIQLCIANRGWKRLHSPLVSSVLVLEETSVLILANF